MELWAFASGFFYGGMPIGVHIVLDGVFILVIVLLLLQKSYQPEKKPLAEREIDELCEEWTPEPLHPPITPEMTVQYPVLESAAGTHTSVNGREVLNLSSANYLGFIGNEEIKENCSNALLKYGVGSCGPRGFYGTIDVHLDLEAKIATFMGTPDSILYAYGLATPASAIPAFCMRGDLIIADEGVHWGIRNGLQLSRSTIRYFRHNDMSSLEEHLEKVFEEDRRKKRALNRRFIVVEALYQSSGKMAPLDEIIRLKEKYRFRVFVDESNSIGVLGKTGRGLSEQFNIPVEKIDIITAAMGCAFGSAGGFCTGSAKVVDHQRLNGLGYVFSASLPPYLATASISAISLLQRSPHLLVKLRKNIATFLECIADMHKFVVASHPLSPLVVLQLKTSTGSFKDDASYLQGLVDEMLENDGVLVTVTKRTPLDDCELPPGIRVFISAAHSQSELESAAIALKRAVKDV